MNPLRPAGSLRRYLCAAALAPALLVGCEDVGLVAYNDTGDAAVSAEQRMEVSPADAIDFGMVSTTGSSSVEELVLTNTGTSVLPVIDVYMDEFTSQAYYIGDDLPLPLRLQPGAAFSLDVYFKPYAVGEFSGGLVIEVEDAQELAKVERDLKGLGCEDGQPQAQGGC